MTKDHNKVTLVSSVLCDTYYTEWYLKNSKQNTESHTLCQMKLYTRYVYILLFIFSVMKLRHIVLDYKIPTVIISN